jgi:16S rRNA (guanine1516-N2)-methyltransferase
VCSSDLSYAVGSQGKVIAMEASAVLHAVVREGLQAYVTGLPDVDNAMRTIQTLHGNHEDILQRMEDKSADIVFFDPMFERPISTSSNLIPLRTQAYRELLTEIAVKEAIRVARKKVILKDRRDSGQFQRLGFNQVRMTTSSVAYGVIAIGQ